MAKNANIPQDVERRRDWIKYQLTIRDSSLAKIAKNNGVSRQVLSSALYSPAPRWESQIAKVIGLSATEIWPERYDKDGLPLPKAKKGSIKDVSEKPSGDHSSDSE